MTFQYRRTSDLHSGALNAEVQQLQMCRKEGIDRLVVNMQIKTSGIPFAENFQIQLRWVITRMPTNAQLLVNVGMFVDFVKPTL